MTSSKEVFDLLRQVKLLAREYYELTEKPLGVTGEIAEYEAARILKVQLAPARQAGYDAIRKVKGREQLLQIKGRRLIPTSKASQRVGGINLNKEWDLCSAGAPRRALRTDRNLRSRPPSGDYGADQTRVEGPQ